MGTEVHRKGNQYRLWSTYTDTYATKPMTRKQMATYLVREATREFQASIGRDVEERMERTAKKGTSSRIGGLRDTTKWDTELCRCGSFHHTFELRASDGKCGYCGEPTDDKAHQPPCVSGMWCDECGAPQQRSPEGQMFCPNGHTSKGVFCG